MRTLALSGVLGCLSITSAATAQEALPAGWLDTQVNERGQRCERRAEHRTEKALLLACGAAGVWEIALPAPGPRFVRSLELGGEVVGFFTEQDGRLWVKLLVLEARPLSSATAVLPGAATFPESGALPPAPPSAPPGPSPASPAVPAPASPTIAAEPRETGRVVRSAPGEVVISLGSADGIARNDRIELALEVADGEVSGEAVLSREAMAVGVVTSVSRQNAKVRLGLNESVPVGAIATPTRAPTTARLASPPRVSGLWSLEAMARPFAALDELGGGVMLSAAFGRRFARGLHLWAIVDPAALGDVESNKSIGVFNGAFFASYDSQYFEMGLGVGAQTVNDTVVSVPTGSGLTVAQFIRLGAVDGLHFTARTNVVLFHSEFGFGGMVGTARIPVSRGYWLQFGGGGGDLGYAYGELGLRVLLRGNGHAGSTFLTVSAGGAGVFRSGRCLGFDPCTADLWYAGPMGGLGLERRF